MNTHERERCWCGHGLIHHQGFDESACSVEKCNCLRYATVEPIVDNDNVMSDAMVAAFLCAKRVGELLARRSVAQATDSFAEVEQLETLLDVARVGLHGAIEALPETERSLLVAMYETLRHWAYR